MITILFVLAIAAFIAACVSAAGQCPLWVSVILLCIIALMHSMPLGR